LDSVFVCCPERGDSWTDDRQKALGALAVAAWDILATFG
jgi:hypothetical protein